MTDSQLSHVSCLKSTYTSNCAWTDIFIPVLKLYAILFSCGSISIVKVTQRISYKRTKFQWFTLRTKYKSHTNRKYLPTDQCLNVYSFPLPRKWSTMNGNWFMRVTSFETEQIKLHRSENHKWKKKWHFPKREISSASFNFSLRQWLHPIVSVWK